MRNLYQFPPGWVPTRMAVHGQMGDETCGAFELRSATANEFMHIMAASGMGWDHVSVSCQYRCPTWDEMEQVKRTFFEDEEFAFQLHLPVADHISVHPYCLHLWCPHTGIVVADVLHVPIFPPKIMVG